MLRLRFQSGTQWGKEDLISDWSWYQADWEAWVLQCPPAHNNRRCNSYIAIPWCQKRWTGKQNGKSYLYYVPWLLGDTSVMADWFSVPIRPSQNVSVRLYIDWIKLLIMTGTASIRIAWDRFPFRIIFRLFSDICFGIGSPCGFIKYVDRLYSYGS